MAKIETRVAQTEAEKQQSEQRRTIQEQLRTFKQAQTAANAPILDIHESSDEDTFDAGVCHGTSCRY